MTHPAAPSLLPPPPDAALRPGAEGLDIARVAQAAGAAGLAVDTGWPPRRFAGGLANRNYLIRAGGGWAVLRRPPDGPLPRGAHDMAREHRVLSRLWQALPLAPRSLFLCTDPAVIGVPFQILEYRSGVAIRGDRLDPLPETEATGRALSGLLVATLARIHAVSPAAVGLADLGRPEGFFARQAAGWLRRAEEIGGEKAVAKARNLAGWLDRHAPAGTGPPVLLHCDFKLDNILLDPASLQPGTVVDWDMCTLGPALFDLATLLSYWTEPGDPDCMHRLAQMPTARPGFATREKAAAAYAAATGRSVEGLRPWRVLTLMKLATVFLQLHRVGQVGADPRYAGFGRLGEDLFDFALDVARERHF